MLRSLCCPTRVRRRSRNVERGRPCARSRWEQLQRAPPTAAANSDDCSRQPRPCRRRRSRGSDRGLLSHAAAFADDCIVTMAFDRPFDRPSTGHLFLRVRRLADQASRRSQRPSSRRSQRSSCSSWKQTAFLNRQGHDSAVLAFSFLCLRELRPNRGRLPSLPPASLFLKQLRSPKNVHQPWALAP